MQILRIGSEGDDVRRWQTFLLGQDPAVGKIDGLYGPATQEATRAFQRRMRLDPDGTVGPLTYAAALQRGFDPGFVDPQGGTSGADWPPRPVFAALASNAERERVFGRFEYERIAEGRDDIRIKGTWVADNIVTVTIPQLAGVRGAPSTGKIRMHRGIAEQTRALFAEWERAGLTRLILTWEGSFVPRFQRGRSVLSNHAWGTAFDINYEWNMLGHLPALRGRKGSVRELVPLANEYGFYWGGHFRGRADGMHFEAARVLA